MLKNVVLPAPLGPIRLTIERSGMSKSTSLTATRPPQTLVIPRASRMLPTLFQFSSATGRAPERVTDVPTFPASQLLGALAVGEDAFGPQEHHEHQDEAEQEEVVLRDVCLAQERAPEGVAYGVDPLVDLRQQVEVEALQDDRTEDHAVDVPHAAEDDHAQHQDRDVEREGVGEDVLYEGAVERAPDTPEDRPQSVGPELRRHRVYAHRRGGGLVLAHRDPGPPQPRVPEAHVDVDRDQHQDQDSVVPRVQVERPEPLPGVEGVGQELQPRRVYRLDAYRPVGQVEAAEVVGVLEEARDDLPAPQGDYRQVVTPQPQGGRTDDHAAQGGEGPGDNEEYPEGDVYARRLLAGYALRRGEQREAHLPELGRGEPADGVGSQGVERHEAQVQEAREPDHDVQTQRQQDVDGHDDHREHQVRLQGAVDDREDERHHDQERREPVLPQQGHGATARPPAPPSGRRGVPSAGTRAPKSARRRSRSPST